jgi:DNA polymerase/3'-5' exonuclease PolX
MKRSIAKKIIHDIRYSLTGLYPIGSYFRREEYVNDLDFVTMSDLDMVLFYMDAEGLDFDIRTLGPKYTDIVLMSDYGPVDINIWKVDDEYELKFAIWTRGYMDKDHSIGYKKMAGKKGYSLSDKGLIKLSTGERVDFDTISDLIDFLKA